MLTISEKSKNLPLSPIRKLVPLAEKAVARGVKIYKLNIGQPDVETPQVALDAIHNTSLTTLAYTHSAGLISYRRKQVEYYRRLGIDLEVDNLITTIGGSEAVMMSITICCNRGDEILVAEPFYANYSTFAKEADVVIVPVPSDIEHNFALPSVEEFEKRITPRTKAILVCNPSNPTGYLYTAQELDKLRALVSRHGLFLIADEVYREFCYDGRHQISALTLKGIEDNVIVVDSISKRYSMCGVRLGCIISRNTEVMAAAMKLAMARLAPPLLAQIAGEAAVDTPQSYFDAVNAEYTARRDTLISELNKIPGVYTPLPEGAFYTMVHLPVDDCNRFAAWLLDEFTFNGATVQIAPGTGFYATEGRGLQEARMAYVIKREDLIAACNILREALKVYPGRTE